MLTTFLRKTDVVEHKIDQMEFLGRHVESLVKNTQSELLHRLTVLQDMFTHQITSSQGQYGLRAMDNISVTSSEAEQIHGQSRETPKNTPGDAVVEQSPQQVPQSKSPAASTLSDLTDESQERDLRGDRQSECGDSVATNEQETPSAVIEGPAGLIEEQQQPQQQQAQEKTPLQAAALEFIETRHRPDPLGSWNPHHVFFINVP